MTCISKEGRCTKCCEAIHIPTKVAVAVRKGDSVYRVDEPRIRKYWLQISKRRAKKINPYIFKRETGRVYLKTASFFKCKALVKNVGCSIRDQEDHPAVCKTYSGGMEYSETCTTDINIIARG